MTTNTIDVTTTITVGDLIPGAYVEGTSAGTRRGSHVFTSTWSGVFDRFDIDTDGVMYAYLTGGHISGIGQGSHGFPVSQLAVSRELPTGEYARVEPTDGTDPRNGWAVLCWASRADHDRDAASIDGFDLCTYTEVFETYAAAVASLDY